jgi:hypothetical protein
MTTLFMTLKPLCSRTSPEEVEFRTLVPMVSAWMFGRWRPGWPGKWDEALARPLGVRQLPDGRSRGRDLGTGVGGNGADGTCVGSDLIDPCRWAAVGGKCHEPETVGNDRIGESVDYTSGGVALGADDCPPRLTVGDLDLVVTKGVGVAVERRIGMVFAQEVAREGHLDLM